MNLRKLIYLICFVGVSLTNVGCSDFLDVKQDSTIDMEDYWTTKEAVASVVMSGYVAMRDNLDKYVIWGDLRADMMSLVSSDDTEKNQFKNLNINSENTLCKWVNTYSVIARCNSVLENAESVMTVDETFDEALCKSYMAEAMWMRALNYFTLVRTFRDVPYITWAYTSDNQEFVIAKTDGEVIMDDLLLDLEEYYPYAQEYYIEEGDVTNEWQNKGRVTKGAYFALMADICLWRERYDETIKWCDSLDYLKDKGLYRMLANADWYTLYYPGNTDESIFELQWDADYSQTNSLYAWFYNGITANSQTYSISSSGASMFVSADTRGSGGTYITTSNKIWKYGGASTTTAAGNDDHQRSYKDNNWIFYRYTDIMLMRAEALIMQGDYSTSYDLMYQVRTRAGAGSSTPSQASNESTALSNLMAERALEFAFEGKRWFDLVRWATVKESIYKSNLTSVMLANVSASLRPLYEVKLEQENSWYLPIYQDDIDAGGGVLVQNPYYN